MVAGVFCVSAIGDSLYRRDLKIERCFKENKISGEGDCERKNLIPWRKQVYKGGKVYRIVGKCGVWQVQVSDLSLAGPDKHRQPDANMQKRRTQRLWKKGSDTSCSMIYLVCGRPLKYTCRRSHSLPCYTKDVSHVTFYRLRSRRIGGFFPRILIQRPPAAQASPPPLPWGYVLYLPNKQCGRTS